MKRKQQHTHVYISEARERELIDLADRSFDSGFSESQTVALIESERGICCEEQAIGIVNKAK